MAADFRIHLRSGVVMVVETGQLDYATSRRAIAESIEAAKAAGTKRILFDLRDADLSNYYSYIVRHAETASERGLDASYSMAVVGQRAQADVLSFIDMVARNRGWRLRIFPEVGPALEWLGTPD